MLNNMTVKIYYSITRLGDIVNKPLFSANNCFHALSHSNLRNGASNP